MTYYVSSGTLNPPHSLTNLVFSAGLFVYSAFKATLLVFSAAKGKLELFLAYDFLVSKVTYYVSSETLNPTHSLTVTSHLGHVMCCTYILHDVKRCLESH